jgi:hypothetical protein
VLDKSPGIVASSTSPIGANPPMKNNRGLDDVACVSDASMSTYMEYLYDQQPIDGINHNKTVTGVPVTISAIDPNGNPVTIGSTTSDLSGTYALTWKPSLAGEYTITASFAGSNAYGSSWAETHAVVVEPQATSTPTATTSTVGLATTSDLLTYIAVAVIAMIITVAIATVLILRKH